MNPSEYIKHKGLKSLKQMAELTGRTEPTLRGWYHRDRELFDLLVMGALVVIARPFGMWISPAMLIASKYTGAAVVRTSNNRSYTVRVLPNGFFHYNNGAQIDIEGISDVMAYDEELGR